MTALLTAGPWAGLLAAVVLWCGRRRRCGGAAAQLDRELYDNNTRDGYDR